MKLTFLQIAEIVLKRERKPLRPEEIVKLSKESGLLVTKGDTPEFSMKARISTEIRKNGFNSKFVRIGPNRFALREFGLKEYVLSKPFKKNLPKEIITCIAQENLSSISNNFGFFSETEDIIKIINNEDNLHYLHRKDAENDFNYKQLISYVLLQNNDGDVLTYKRGSYSNAHKMIKGATCLGFGGHIQDIDTRKLFNKGFGGIFDTAEREVSEELKGIKPENLKIIGYINDNSSPEGLKHFCIVVKAKIPDDFKIEKVDKELSINGVKFMNPSMLWEHFYEFEFWSQLIIRNLYSSHIINPVVIKPSKFNILSNIIVFVGEIASGKSIICEILSEKLGFNHISTRKCVAKLIGMRDFGTRDRAQFQKNAAIFINQNDGPKQLAFEIQRNIEMVDSFCVIDGIRHKETLKELRKIHPNLTVIYIESTRDDSFRNFLERSNGMADINQFREARHHPVEEEIQQIKYEADAYIFNGGNKEQLFETFLNWFNLNFLKYE